MRTYSLNTVALAFVVLGLLVPTGAVAGDQLFPSATDETARSIYAAPADGPNGDYATLNDAGNLSVDLSSIGVNPDATTTVRRVFTISNRGDRAMLVWVTHDGADAVAVRSGEAPIQGSERAVRLDPGDRVPVGFHIDVGENAAGEQLMSGLTVRARFPGEDTATPTPEPTPTPSEPTPPNDGGGGDSGADDGGAGGAEPGPVTATATVTTAPTPTPTTTTTGGGTPVPTSTPVEGVSVSFSVPVDGPEVTVEELDALPPDPRDGGPRAAVLVRSGDEVDTDGGGLDAPEGVDTDGFVPETGGTVLLDASGSTIGTADGIDPGRRTARIVRVLPEPGLRETPGTVEIRVPRDRLPGGTESAQIARLTTDGWQPLATRVADTGGGSDASVTLAADTPGYGMFAVFSDSGVRYEWTISGPSGTERVSGPQPRAALAEPGRYEATVTVTDARGRSDTAAYRLLVNDRPNVSLDRPASIAPGQPVTLHANVTDEVGETTVEWRFEDGRSLVGPSVNRSFETGRHVVVVTVTDEYGATRTREFVIEVGQQAELQPGMLSFDGPGPLLLPVLGLLVLLLLAGRYPGSTDRYDRSIPGRQGTDGPVVATLRGVYRSVLGRPPAGPEGGSGSPDVAGDTGGTDGDDSAPTGRQRRGGPADD